MIIFFYIHLRSVHDRKFAETKVRLLCVSPPISWFLVWPISVSHCKTRAIRQSFFFPSRLYFDMINHFSLWIDITPFEIHGEWIHSFIFSISLWAQKQKFAYIAVYSICIHITIESRVKCDLCLLNGDNMSFWSYEIRVPSSSKRVSFLSATTRFQHIF